MQHDTVNKPNTWWWPNEPKYIVINANCVVQPYILSWWQNTMNEFYIHNMMLKHNVLRCKCEVCLTVNNVGRQYTYPMYLGEVPQQELWDIVNINIGATTMMTRLILPQMQKRKRGAIVNVSSGSELQPLPLMTVYAASKVHYLQLISKFS
jgi:hypothetical protein